MIQDIDTEQALLSNLINYGFDSYHDIASLGISSNTFIDSSHQIVYKCLHHLFESQEAKQIDFPLLVNAAKSLGYDKWITQEEVKNNILDITAISTKIENASTFAKKLRKIEVANNIYNATIDVQQDILDITGEESLGDIFGIVESKLSSLADFLTDANEDPINFADIVQDHVKKLVENPVDQIGIPTGFPIFDKCIGGGLRKHAVTVIAARMKVGKSTLCKNMAQNVAQLDIPVLYLDTEMQSEDQMNRILASTASVTINDVETGNFHNNLIHREKIKDAADKLSTLKFFYKNISGQSVENTLAIMRKWIIKHVGLTKEGKAKDCLVVFDYIKIMEGKDLSSGIQEYQALGFLMTALQNFAVKYDIPVLTAVQVNRDGISVEDTSVIGGSDRIAMYGSSVSLLKWKSPEEMDAENHNYGNQKLVPLISRYGEQLDFGDYINVMFDKKCNKMSELGTRGESQAKVGYKQPAKEETKYPKKNYSKKAYSKVDNDDTPPWDEDGSQYGIDDGLVEF